MSQTVLQDTAQYLKLGTTRVELDVSGALWLPGSRTLVFSDLHFEKGSSYGAKGVFLPPYDTAATLKAMAEVIARRVPEMIISLGDAFHDVNAEQRMVMGDVRTLQDMTRRARWIWISGNHDPLPPKAFTGTVYETVSIEGLEFGHEPTTCGNWQIAGHMHPVAKLRQEGQSVRRRCFISDGQRLILPSFGAYTGGLNVLHEAYKPFFQTGFDVFMLGKTRVYPVPLRLLRPDSV